MTNLIRDIKLLEKHDTLTTLLVIEVDAAMLSHPKDREYEQALRGAITNHRLHTSAKYQSLLNLIHLWHNPTTEKI